MIEHAITLAAISAASLATGYLIGRAIGRRWIQP